MGSKYLQARRKFIPRESTIRVLVYRPNAAPTVELIENDLKALQSAVQGRIECFRTGVEGTIGVNNEEFLFLGLEPCRFIAAPELVICGGFLICGDIESDEGKEFASLTDEQIARITTLIP